MGDRYTITADGETLAERFEIEVTENYQPRFNAAPTQILPVITQGSKGLSYFYWGQIPEWSKNKSLSAKLLYAESDTVHKKASTKHAFQSARCIIPIDGFYAWKKVSKKGKIPHRFIFGSNEIRSCAGLWEEFEDEDGQTVHTFKILTTNANEIVGEVDDQMPVILEKQQEKIWLQDSQESELLELLKSYPTDKMGSYTVSPRIMDPSNEGPTLIKPFAPADQFGNYSLFD